MSHSDNTELTVSTFVRSGASEPTDHILKFSEVCSYFLLQIFTLCIFLFLTVEG
jgi:hypothetical protein